MGTAIGAILFVVGTFITCINFYLSWLRYPIFRLLGGARDDYRWMSGVPLVGSLLLWCCIPLLSHYPRWKWAAFAISIFDTGGIHWIVIGLLAAALRLNDRDSNGSS